MDCALNHCQSISSKRLQRQVSTPGVGHVKKVKESKERVRECGFSCPHFKLWLCCSAVDSSIRTRHMKSRYFIILAVLQIYNIPSLQQWDVQISCSVHSFPCIRQRHQSQGYDECLLARGEWVVWICQRCYYSRQQSYRPISCTIITVISSRSSYSSSQLSTSQPDSTNMHLPRQPCTSVSSETFGSMFLKGPSTASSHLA